MQRILKFVTALSFAFCTLIIIFSGANSDYGSEEIQAAEIIPVERKYVVVSGNVFGIRLYSDGVIIVGTGNVPTSTGSANPAASAGLKIGDVIKATNGQRVTKNTDLSKAVEDSDGSPIELLVERDGEKMVLKFTPALSAEDNKYKAGLWIRDSTAGIGTITYFDPETLTFAGLGHGICDIDTGEIMPLFGGDAVYADVADVYRGSKSETGELCGIFKDEIIGSLLKNTEYGVSGTVTKNEITGTTMPVAVKYEVKIGKAQIIATIDDKAPKKYDIEITKIYLKDKGTKSMAITVTDEELIKATGGIIQGMSGSPIIQNGMLVGAVTHVLVNDPTRGYGIFAENMLNSLQTSQ